VDGDELKVRCKYCNRVLNARYLQLLRHSLSNKHLCSAAAAIAVSLPMDVDSCKAADTSVHLSEDDEMVTDVENDRINVGADESMDAEWKSSNVHHFDDDAVADNIHGRRKVSRYIHGVRCF